ncbi:MAG TPA: isoprenylcysteine carboxylmethyltransferase family protein, partial [Candidatus Limnocylindrales bacterium]
MNVRQLIGAGDRIALAVAPVVVVGLAANLVWPSAFTVGGPSEPVRLVSIGVLVAGIAVWLWSAALILTQVPRHRLITGGPFAIVRHPLYTGVALLVIPWAGLLLDTWIGAVIGLGLYVAARH